LFDLSNIANETYVDKLSLNKSLVKLNIIYANPTENAWRIPLLKDLLLIRSNPNVLEGFYYDEIDVIIDDICKKLTKFLFFIFHFIVFDYILILYFICYISHFSLILNCTIIIVYE